GAGDRRRACWRLPRDGGDTGGAEEQDVVAARRGRERTRRGPAAGTGAAAAGIQALQGCRGPARTAGREAGNTPAATAASDAAAGWADSAAPGRIVGPRQCLRPAAARDNGTATATDFGRSDTDPRLHGRDRGPFARYEPAAAVAVVHAALDALAAGRLLPGDSGVDAAIHCPGGAGRAVRRHLGVTTSSAR